MHRNTNNIQSFWVAGINYKKTDASVRGQFAVNCDQYDYLLSVGKDHKLTEFFIVSTCNRTEIYGLCSAPHQLIDLICNVTSGDAATFTDKAYIKNGYDAINHLFQVGGGLDSQILGDYEILGQIKNAVKQSKNKGCIGVFMERLVNNVLQSSKAIKTHTALSSGTVSVSFAAMQYIKQNVLQIQDKKILLVGMGKMGKSTCRNLIHYLHTHNITLINRTEQTASVLAEELGIAFAPLENLQEKIDEADIVIVSTNAPEPIILKHQLENKGTKLIIDLSVPCNVEEGAHLLDGISLINVDTLSKIKDETLENRKREIPKALNIIADHITEFNEWLDMRRHVPVIKKVKSKLQELNINATVQHTETVNQEEKIQTIINVLATKMRRSNTPGCHYIEAINDFIAYYE
ncbi:MAG: glutamyl-tRNA reductase [Taibaiella sp.]|nr:glutamyl-tRNA reductase [Taibaiella sp.]